MMATLRADPSTSEEEHFRLVLVQTEMERGKWLVRSYVRARLHKVGSVGVRAATGWRQWLWG
jgi:GINS complex subunit 4